MNPEIFDFEGEAAVADLNKVQQHRDALSEVSFYFRLAFDIALCWKCLFQFFLWLLKLHAIVTSSSCYILSSGTMPLPPFFKRLNILFAFIRDFVSVPNRICIF